MIKKWDQFDIIKENSNKISDIFGNNYLSDVISDNFYFLFDVNNYGYLSKSNFYFIDDTNWIRSDIKIGEKLNPSIIISIFFNESKVNNELLKDIEFAIKKLKTIFKIKYNLKLDINILDPELTDFYEHTDFSKSKLSDEKDPFKGLSIEDGLVKYGDKSSNNLIVYLKQEEKITITPLEFAKFYLLRNYHIKNNELYVKLTFKDIAEILFGDPSLIGQLYEPIESYKTEYDYEIDFDGIKEYIESEVIGYIKDYIIDDVNIINGKVNLLEIRFDPNLFLNDYGIDEETEFWDTSWGNELYDSDLSYIMKDFFFEHYNGLNFDKNKFGL